MSAVVVDASVWVSRLVASDVNHAASRVWLEKFAVEENQFVVPTLVLAEISGSVARRAEDAKSGHEAVKLVLRLPSLRLINVDRALSELAAQLAADYKLRGADSIYVAAAKQLNIPLVTLDEEQFKRASKIIQTIKP
ncbi:MAG: type II toxin-antitoxin system VapC family toxin [Chloroflexi bacterium]|nr:type II toxin-antitoxin system VapC family toxin [Chloroflexota bacterium]